MTSKWRKGVLVGLVALGLGGVAANTARADEWCNDGYRSSRYDSYGPYSRYDDYRPYRRYDDYRWRHRYDTRYRYDEAPRSGIVLSFDLGRLFGGGHHHYRR